MTVSKKGLRKRRDSTFVQVPSTTIRDPRLSFKARGLLAYLLDMPEGWDVRSDQIAGVNPTDGKASIRTALHELGKTGYYRLERRRVGGGLFEMGTAISETPVPEWAADYAEYDGKAVPLEPNGDGTYRVKHKDGSLTADGFVPIPETVPSEPQIESVDDVSAGHTEDRFSDPGQMDVGSPDVGRPNAGFSDVGQLGAINKQIHTDGYTDSEMTTTSSSPRGPSDSQPQLSLVPDPLPVVDVVDDVVGLADGITKAWHAHYVATVAPIVKKPKSNPFVACRNLVAGALKAGFTDLEVRHALKACGEPLPQAGRFQRELGVVRSGRPAVGEKPGRQVYRNDSWAEADDPYSGWGAAAFRDGAT